MTRARARPRPPQGRWVEAVAVHDVIAAAPDHLEDVLVGIVEGAQGVPRLAGPDERGRQTRRVDPRLDDVRSVDPRTRRRIDIDVVSALGQPDRQIGDHHLRSALLRLRDGRHQRRDDRRSAMAGPALPAKPPSRPSGGLLALALVSAGYVFSSSASSFGSGSGFSSARRLRFRQLGLALGLDISLLGLAQRLVRIR